MRTWNGSFAWRSKPRRGEGAAEAVPQERKFRNTHFSYVLGADGVEQFVSTPELHSDEAIEADPLPPGQVWAISNVLADKTQLLRSTASKQQRPGSGVRTLDAALPDGEEPPALHLR